jgi:hypothetical protein
VDPELLAQFPFLEETLCALGVVVWAMEEYEADDALASAAFLAREDSRVKRVVMTSGKAINHKVLLYGRIGQVLLEAKRQGGDAFAAIESVMSWDDFASSVTDAQKLAQPADFDFLYLIGESYSLGRRNDLIVVEEMLRGLV